MKMDTYSNLNLPRFNTSKMAQKSYNHPPLNSHEPHVPPIPTTLANSIKDGDFDYEFVVRHQGRIPIEILDPYPTLGVQHNYPREVLASTGKSFSSMQLLNAYKKGAKLQEELVNNFNKLHDGHRVALAFELNNLFLSCLSIEDQRALSTLLYTSKPKTLEFLGDTLMEGSPLSYIVINTLYNYSYSIEARKTMASLGVIEIVMSTFQPENLLVMHSSIDFLLEITDHLTPKLRSRLLIQNGVRRIFDVIRHFFTEYQSSNGTRQSTKVLLNSLLVILERIVFYKRSRAVVYRYVETLKKLLNELSVAFSAHVDKQGNTSDIDTAIVIRSKRIQQQIITIDRFYL